MLRVGTRGSALALWQARHVAERLAVATELVEIRTGGDLLSDVPLSEVEGKAFFTKEIEEALLAGEIDLAVHSLKDLATTLPEGLTIGAVLEREDARDVVIARPGASWVPAAADRALRGGLDHLPNGARVGTSSLRRRAFLARQRPDLEVVDLRGNVPTRIRRLDEGEFDALVLAAAGVKRLGLADRIAGYLAARVVPPAPGQGAIAVQIRSDDEAAARLLSALDHGPTRAETHAERAFLRRLEGGCQVPVGASAHVEVEDFILYGAICSLDGRRCVDGQRGRGLMDLRDPETLGLELAEALLRRGGAEILASIRRPTVEESAE